MSGIETRTHILLVQVKEHATVRIGVCAQHNVVGLGPMPIHQPKTGLGPRDAINRLCVVGQGLCGRCKIVVCVCVCVCV